MKISIVGTGRVGAAIGMVLVARHLVDDLVLVGRRAGPVEAEALDLLHASAFGPPTKVHAGDIAATAGSDIIVYTAATALDGVGGGGRAEGASANYQVLKSLVPGLAAASPEAILLLTTNPVDALTTLAGDLSGFPRSRVLGTGTLLDTMRLRSSLSERLGMRPGDIRAYVLGEHGDSQFAAFSSANAGGGPLGLPAEELARIEATTRRAGHDIMVGKGFTNHGIALAAAEVIESIIRDARQVMPLSIRMDGFAGVDDVCLSLPVIIGRRGVVRCIDMRLDESETVAFLRCASAVREHVRMIRGQSQPA